MENHFYTNRYQVLETRYLIKICIELESYKLEFCWGKFYKHIHAPGTRTDKIFFSPHSLTHNTQPHQLIASLTTLPLTLTHHIASLTTFPSQQIHISGKGFLI